MTDIKREDKTKNKRVLLSYWKSLDLPTVENGSEKDGLLEELKKSIYEMDSCCSDVIIAENEVNHLQNEQLSIFKELQTHLADLVTDKTSLDLNANLKTDEHQDRHKEKLLKDEKGLLLVKNEQLKKEVETLKVEYAATNKDQQRDIEKLTREVQNSNITRRNLERELSQATQLNEENNGKIKFLHHEVQTTKEKYENKITKLSDINEQVSKDNSQLVEKGKEAMESLKIALQQLTEEKETLQEALKPNSDKETKSLKASLERAKTEREAFRQRCEKSEIIQNSLQQEIVSLQKEIKDKGKEIKPRDGGKEKTDNIIKVEMTELKSARSRISQLKNYVHILEDRAKEREETILSLRKENARVNDMAMEKSLELSRSRRILEKKIEKLVRENSEWKRNFLIPDHVPKINELPSDFPTTNIQSKTGQPKIKDQIEERKDQDINTEEDKQSKKQQVTNGKIKNVTDAESATNNEQISVMAPVEIRKVDVAPKRRIGGKFIRTSSKRHSADLGRLMSRQHGELSGGRKSDSDLLRGTEPATIFVNRCRKTAEEHWV